MSARLDLSKPLKEALLALDEGKVESMKKIHTIILAVIAVFAFGALTAASASAETILGAEWLANGAAVSINLASLITGEALVEDTGSPGSAAVECSGILEGVVGAAGKGEITSILNLAKEVISSTKLVGLGLSCTTEKTCGTPISVWPTGLPWKTQLSTMENGEILDTIEKSGYELTCVVLGITVTDECTATTSALPVINNAVTGDAETPSGRVSEPLDTCTLSKATTGVNETVGAAFITLVSGELLSVNAL